MESSNKKKVTTLENPNLRTTNIRRDGNTTRCVDNAIQILFEGNICVVLDPFEYGRNKNANRHLFERILERLNFEHNYLFVQKMVHIDKQKLEIYLLEK